MTQTKLIDWPLSGRLEAAGLPPVIAEIGRRGASGSLHVRRRSVHRVVHFRTGRIRFASSSNPNDRLGEYLLRAGHVTLVQLERALSEQSSGKRIGTLLVEAGVLQHDDLVDAVQEQIRTIVFDLMGWSEGSYHFDAEASLGDEDIELDISTTALLLRGMPAVRAMKLIERGVGTARSMFRLADNWGVRCAELDLSECARAIADQLDGGPDTVEALCREVCCSSFEVYRTLWALRLTELIEPVPRSCGGEEHQGNFAETTLAEEMIHLEAAGETGVLYATRGAVERSIMFAAGRCVFGTSNDPDDGLVNFLFRRGVISLRDREETLRRLLSNKRVGTILLELGAIDDDDLQQMVRQQVSEIIYDTLGWADGEYVFVSGMLPHAEEITLNTSAGALIAEGVRRVTSWTRLMRGCGGVDNPLCLTPRYLEVLDAMEGSVAEWEIVNALKSPQTPRRVCGMTDLNDLRVCQILWTLKLLGAVEESPVEVAEEPLDDAEMAAAPAGAVVGASPEPPPAAEAEPVSPASTREVEAAADPQPEPEACGSQADEPVETAVEPRPPLDTAIDRADVERALRDLSEQEQTEQGGNGANGGSVATADSFETGEETWADEQPPSPQPQWEVPDGVEDVILRFNAMHRVVFRAVRSEVGAGAANFVRSCCLNVPAADLDPLEGVQLHSDGSWDIDDLKRVIVEKAIEDPWPAYQAVLDQEFVSLQPHLGKARAGQLKQQIWEIQQN